MSKKKLCCLSSLVAFILTIVMIFSNFSAFETLEVKGVDADVKLELVTDTTTAYTGDEVTVKVNMSKNVGLTGIRFRVTFDADVLELKSVKADSTLPLATTNKAATFVGYAFAAIKQDDDGNDCDWTATGNLVTIKFKVKDTATTADTKLKFDMENTDATDLAINKLNVEVNELSLNVACKQTTTETTITNEPQTEIPEEKDSALGSIREETVVTEGEMSDTEVTTEISNTEISSKISNTEVTTDASKKADTGDSIAMVLIGIMVIVVTVVAVVCRKRFFRDK